MRALATRYCAITKTTAAPLLVTSFGTVRIAWDTAAEIEAEIPNWLRPHDQRTKAWRRLCEIQRDIEAIAEVEWLHGGVLKEF